MLLKTELVLRAYALGVVPTSSCSTAQEKGKSTVLEGLIFILDILIHASFDTGVSHSFISCSMVSCCIMNPTLSMTH